MSKGTEEIRRMFERRLQEAAETIFYGEVAAVNESARTCTIVMEDIPYDNVLLYAVENTGLRGLVILPKVGSKVLVERMANDRYLVTMFSEVDKVILTVEDETTVTVDTGNCFLQVGESSVRVTGKGLTLVKGSAGLKKTLEELLDAIMKLTVPTGVGPSGMPINTADFLKIKQGLNDYLEG